VPTDADYLAIYDLENIIPAAIAQVFTANGFTAASALTAQSDPASQSKRPRIEIWLKVNGAYLPVQEAHMPQDVSLNSAYKGTLTIYAVSAADNPGKLVHSIFRSRVRALTAQMPYLVNGVYLTKHKLHAPMVDGDTAVSIKTENDLQMSTLTYSINFSIQNDAWAAIL